MENRNFLASSEIKKIHFIGIGGISMSGLAEILASMGYQISGSDIKPSNITEKLQGMGARIYIGHSSNNIKDPDLVIYTAAVKEDNPELTAARDLNIPVMDRATLLGLIMDRYPKSIAVSGTHGKTTTTSIVTMIMLESMLDPTVHIGGELGAIGGNTRIGSEKYFIAEACEYVESFLKFKPYLAVVLNIEADHLDYYRDLEHIKGSFLKFVSGIPEDGWMVVNADDENASTLLGKVSCKSVTYGINNKATWTAKNIRFNSLGCASFDVYNNDSFYQDISLSIPGMHNVSNSLAAIASCSIMGCPKETIKSGILRFTGTHRRFETKGIADGIRVVDDYAHHPSEVQATLNAAKNAGYNRIWSVFQPHTYTRTKFLMDEFAASFNDADRVIITDIYAAREKDTGEVHAKMLCDRLKKNKEDSLYISGFDNIVDYLVENAESGDLVITLGAGDVYRVGEMFLEKKSKG